MNRFISVKGNETRATMAICLKRLSEWEDAVHRVTDEDWLFLYNSSSVSTLYPPILFLFLAGRYIQDMWKPTGILNSIQS